MKKITLLFFATVAFLNTKAQKLPNTQQASLRVPINIKIDGKASEWGDKLQAYNPATEFYYSMANDEKKLYLAIQATDPDVINRIASGGITLFVKEKNAPNSNGISIQYPVLKNRSNLFFRLRTPKNTIPDTTAMAADSTMRVNNKTLDNLAKWIKVTGIKNIDTLSIYNETSFEAASRFDLKKALTIEIALPLDSVKTQINNLSAFTYQLRVNGGTAVGITFGPLIGSTLDAEGQAKLMESMKASVNTLNAKLSAATDFWGDYILAK